MLATVYARGHIELGWLDELIVWANFTGALCNAVLYWLTYRGEARRRARRMLAVIGTLALVYVVSYVVLILGPWSQTDWARVMRGVALMAWVGPWPSFALWILLHRGSARLRSADELVDLLTPGASE